jgi:hypothetical protein
MNRDNINIHGERSKFKQFIINLIGLEFIGVVLYGFGLVFGLIPGVFNLPAIFNLVLMTAMIGCQFFGALIIIFAFIPAFASSYFN